MYQSVGTTIPPLIAEAMGLPHYTRVIKGGAVEQGAEYGSREHGGEVSGQEGDETEDLTALLKTIIVSPPCHAELTHSGRTPGSHRYLVGRHPFQLPTSAHRACLPAPRPHVAGVLVAERAASSRDADGQQRIGSCSRQSRWNRSRPEAGRQVARATAATANTVGEFEHRLS